MDVMAALSGISVDEIKRWGWIMIGSAFVLVFVLGFITERILLYRKGWRKKDED